MNHIYTNHRGSYGREPSPEQCKTAVRGEGRGVGFYQCSFKPKRDGWCGKHHPDAEAKRREASDERLEAKAARRNAPSIELTALRARVSELEAERDAQRDLILDTYEWFLEHVGHDGAPDGGDPPWVSDVFGLIGGEESHYPPDFEAILLSAVKRRANARAALLAAQPGEPEVKET